MPGTPATSPRLGIARYGDDPTDFDGHLNAITDGLDSKIGRFESGPISARPAAGIARRLYHAADEGKLYVDNGTAWIYLMSLGGGSGVSVVTAVETRSSSTLGVLGTPDRVSAISHPTGGIMRIGFSAMYKLTPGIAASTHRGAAAIFIGGTQLGERRQQQNVGVQQAVLADQTTVTHGFWTPIGTAPYGLVADMTSSSAGDTASVATGEVIGGYRTEAGLLSGGGHMDVWAPAGIYDIEVRYSSTDANAIQFKDRRLWVRSKAV